MDRREWLTSWQGLLAALGGLVALPLASHAWRSSRERDRAPAGWADLGPVSKIAEGAWQPRTLAIEAPNRWRRDVREEVVYVRRTAEGLEALSAICPHTGCLVRAEGGGFACPCHRSFFDAAGRNAEGPAPRPLDRIECKVERGRGYVRYRRFRPGLAQAEPVEG
jgi:Rieske Fe-S protein